MSQQPEQTAPGITYAAAGVDTAAGDRAVALMKDAVAATMTPAVVGGVGGFAGLVDVSALRDYRRPLLATSTDGVGTKVAIAQALDIHDTIGQDLVGMVVDDIVVVGARPLLMTDYIACGHVVPERIADIVRGVAQACAAVGTPLLGGETAEHPGLMAPDEYDVAGAATGVVEADRMLGAEKVCAGDVLVALGASGLHSNGYSLVRRVIEHAGWGLEREVPEFGRTLGEELLEPTRLYTRVCLAMLETLSSPAAPGPVHALSHITGGGLAANVARVLPAGLIADIDRASWAVPPVFSTVRELGSVPWEDLEGTLNLGVGMVAVVDPTAVDAVLRVAEGSDIPAWVLGEVHEAAKYEAQDRVISGTKGVDGGAIDIHGAYRTA
ncbi:phosphoribosylformylglycinamidine cyclo-ligase [Actinomyces sp. ZJ308]|uniref:phosphoribosylformylglycinamidine cyclo-ligase n=1 Tax=Actinomyces sp. ZJ308 TaxID=2708342 RepID=UPI00141E77DF|nr:phosphoribosylformylglycinamidine cyclo-ligase [Actinomyces sp. ZJ308]